MPKMELATMLRQQAQVELGENYAEAEREATTFVKWLLAKNWFDKNEILSGEGSAAQMVETALAYIVKENDIELGIKAYLKELSSEYDRKKPHKKDSSLQELAERNIDIPEREDGVGGASDFPFGGKRLAPEGLRLLQVMGQDELDLFSTLASIGIATSRGRAESSQGGTREAADLLGWPVEDARRLYRRVRSRVRQAALTHKLFNM